MQLSRSSVRCSDETLILIFLSEFQVFSFLSPLPWSLRSILLLFIQPTHNVWYCRYGKCITMLLADHSETGPKGITSWKSAAKAISNLSFEYLWQRITSLSRKLLLVEENPGNDLNGRLPTTRHTTTWSYVYYVIEDPAVREQLMSFFFWKHLNGNTRYVLHKSVLWCQ